MPFFWYIDSSDTFIKIKADSYGKAFDYMCDNYQDFRYLDYLTPTGRPVIDEIVITDQFIVDHLIQASELIYHNV